MAHMFFLVKTKCCKADPLSLVSNSSPIWIAVADLNSSLIYCALAKLRIKCRDPVRI